MELLICREKTAQIIIRDRCVHPRELKINYGWRPYRAEYTGSLPNSEVNRRRARSVLNWGTVREHPWVLPAFFMGGQPGPARSREDRQRQPGLGVCRRPSGQLTVGSPSFLRGGLASMQYEYRGA